MQQWLMIKLGRMWTAMRPREMGQPDELKILVSNQCEVANPSTPMIGYQFQLPITGAGLVPQIGKFLSESILVSLDPYSGGSALVNL